MAKLYLVKPSIQYEKEFTDMSADWLASGEPDIPWYVRSDGDFLSLLSRLEGFSKGVGLPEGFVQNTTYWLVNKDKKVLGAINIRHRLTDFFLNFGGQIGYGVRPSERCKGYGREMLRLGLIEARKIGLQRVLICCYRDNVPSAAMIEGNGGVLEDERVINGKALRRYWVAL